MRVADIGPSSDLPKSHPGEFGDRVRVRDGDTIMKRFPALKGIVAISLNLHVARFVKKSRRSSSFLLSILIVHQLHFGVRLSNRISR
jgi:hypothetical protein